MDRKYDEVMDKVEVTPEMRQRILNNLQNMDLSGQVLAQVVRFPRWRQWAAIAACLAVVLAGALALPRLMQGQEDPNVAVTNGIVEVASVEELSETLGFAVTEPALPFRVEKTVYLSYWKELAEITYSGEGQTAVYRQGLGTEDVSGDYEAYPTQTELEMGDLAVTLKGESGVYVLAVWYDGECAHSLSLSQGVDEEDWQTLLD